MEIEETIKAAIIYI